LHVKFQKKKFRGHIPRTPHWGGCTFPRPLPLGAPAPLRLTWIDDTGRDFDCG